MHCLANLVSVLIAALVEWKGGRPYLGVYRC